MLLYRGAPAGPGAPVGGLARQGSGPQAFGIRLSTMSPRYLQSNSSSHTRPFSAIAELLDNAVDPDVSARTVFIDVEEVKNKSCLTFTDDGCGMTPHKLHRMLSFGFTDKVIKKSQCPIGVFGNGFKSGSMRLGKDALVFTKNGGTLTVGLLSQTYLECVQAQAVIVPIVPFSQQNKKMIITEDSLPSLEAILNYSIFNSENDLLSQFDAIPGKKGTRVLIWNIRRNKDGKSELDFDTDQYDILVSDFDAEEKEISGSELPETEYSLRAYCSILYMKPRMKIFLRQKKVTTQMIAKSLANVGYDIYKPTFTNKQVRITFGFSCKKTNQFGVMMYHNNRLIKFFEKVGCQPTHGEGVGVIGVIECNFLKPAYNKQDFEYTKEYRLTINALAQKLNAYWKEKISQENFEISATARKIPDQTWVQCDECLKWRKLPGKVDPCTLPARWFCYYNSHPKYRRCSVPEEQELIDEDLYLSKTKKQDQSVEKKKISMENENLQAFSNPPKIPSVQDMAGLNDKTIEYERIDSPTLLPSVGEESRSPSLQLKPLDSSVFQFSSKYKWILGEEPVEKRRRLQNEMPTSPLDYSMPGSYRRVEAAVAYAEGENSHDKSSSERSTPPCLFPEYPEANKNTGQNRETSVLYPGAQDQRQGSLLPEELEDQMPRLVAEESNRGESNRGSTNINKEEVNKGPFVAVVGVAKGVRDSGAPIQLIPFNREELAERRKTVESWNPVPYSSVASAAAIGEKGRGYEESGGRNTPKMKNQRELEELKRTTEKLERVLAERNLFQQKVEELEQERNHWHSEFKKVQHELVTYSTQETEGLYWSKKHMGYRQAEFQILKAELERTKEEKQELQEKLKETETHLEVLRKAQVSYRTPEGDDLERALAKLTRLRIHVSYLLTSVLPHLELREIGYDSEQVDGILYTVLEANHILD
ncbi:MORC family CW-type zinc finger 4, transcript variant X1 [Ictidomys tridecemlineatus]|uniref:MORC family CW-type zinc finger 4 n=1 Tax=Ictidomys tridecemlineatus TaxID=43179 RepID=I3MV87_ICTTR|nr:MORC family CW-type zinc finger protein 4 isoform X1 [Ictidomys tridecemlineatus]KAG3272709.1 MORC family CW-type zinc finger 4, transcript variant X1 [Ictidomys tridecemlineatus]